MADQDDFDVSNDVPALARYLKDKWHHGAAPGILDGFAWGITEQPHKLPYYAALLLVLSKEEFQIASTDAATKSPASGAHAALSANKDRDAEADIDEALGGGGGGGNDEDAAKGTNDMDVDKPAAPSAEELEAQRKKNCLSWIVLQDLGVRFRQWVDARDWLNIRLTVSFFGHLVPLGLITPESFLATLKTFISVLEEFGGGGKRAGKVIRVVTEGLLRAGPKFYESQKTGVDEIISIISSYITAKEPSRALYNTFFLPTEVARGDVHPESDQLDNALSTLRMAQEAGFTKISWLPEPSRRFINPDEDPMTAVKDVYSIPEVSVPPEFEGEAPSASAVNAYSPTMQGEGLTGSFTLNGKIGLTDGRVPNPSTPDGWVMQAMILDILSIYEVNRVKCAEILLKLTDFCLLDIFRSKPLPGEEEAADIAVPGEWVLASTLVSVILSTMLRLPKSPHHTIYLTSVIRELCLANGAMMAPPVGLALRNIYTHLDQGLDVEIARRTAEWFSTHLSNFAFQWMWKAWVPDLELPLTHPKRAFMHRLIELEIRLAYQERILETLPDEMVDETSAPALQMPDPVFPYESPDHPLHEQAMEIFNMVNGKEESETVLKRILELAECSSANDTIPLEYRRIAAHCVLQIGARSFSHFLNATERYLHLLRHLAHTAKGRRELLVFVREFWETSSQMRVMVIDKYLQYDLVDYQDVVAIVFDEFSRKPATAAAQGRNDRPTVWTDFHAWELLNNALIKSKGRLIAIGKRIALTEKADEAVRAKRNALVDNAAAAAAAADETLDQPVLENAAESNTAAADAAAIMVDETPAHKADDQVSHEVQALLGRKRELEAERSTLMVQVVSGFVDSLVPGKQRQASDVLPSQLVQVVDGDYSDPMVWDTVARLGYYREFMRSVSL